MTHGVTIQGHTAHAGGTTHRPIPAATHSGRDIHADLQRVHGWQSPIVLRDPTPDALAPETKRAQADVKRYAAPRQRRWDRPAPQPSVNVAEIVRRYTAGQTIARIAREMGHTKNTVRGHVKASGVPVRDDRKGNGGRPAAKPAAPVRAPRPARPPRPTIDTADIIRRYRAGASIHTIAEDTGHSFGTVRRRLIHADEPLRPQGNGDGVKAAARRLRDAHVTPAQVRAWGLAHGLMTTAKGIIPNRIIDAYLDAHTERKAAS